MITLEFEEEEYGDPVCPVCDSPIFMSAQQEFGQALTVTDPLYVHGECPVCGECYCTIYWLDPRETEGLAEEPQLS